MLIFGNLLTCAFKNLCNSSEIEKLQNNSHAKISKLTVKKSDLQICRSVKYTRNGMYFPMRVFRYDFIDILFLYEDLFHYDVMPAAQTDD